MLLLVPKDFRENNLEQNILYYNLHLVINGDMVTRDTRDTLSHNQHLKDLRVIEITILFSKRAKRRYHSSISDSMTVQ